MSSPPLGSSAYALFQRTFPTVKPIGFSWYYINKLLRNVLRWITLVTRRLERLSLVGVVVSILVVVSVVYAIPLIIADFRYFHGITEPIPNRRNSVLQNLPDNDLRVDYHSMIAGKTSRDVLREGLKKFPNSPRLLLRYGINYIDGKIALRKAAEIDKENAAPILGLAMYALWNKQYEAAIRSTIEATSRPRLNYYPIPKDLLHLDTYFQRRQFPYSIQPSPYSLDEFRVLAEYAEYGRTSEAVEICKALQIIGLRGLRTRPCCLLTADRFARLYTAGVRSEGKVNANSPEWRQKRDESVYLQSALEYAQELHTARAGVSGVLTAVWILLLMICAFGVLASNLLRFYFTRRSKRKAASTLHDQATREVFSTLGLTRLYGWTILLPCVLQAIVIAYMWNQTGVNAVIARSNPHWITGIAAIVVILLPAPAIALVWAWKGYARAFEKLSRRKLPRTWKSGQDEDKRELHRRLSGVLGGGLALLAACLLFSSLLITHRAPWNYADIWPDVTQEDRIVQDIVQHKLQVPLSYTKGAESRSRL